MFMDPLVVGLGLYFVKDHEVLLERFSYEWNGFHGNKPENSGVQLKRINSKYMYFSTYSWENYGRKKMNHNNYIDTIN